MSETHVLVKSNCQTPPVRDGIIPHSFYFGRRIKHYVTNILISNNRTTWVFFSLVLTFAGFYLFAFLSPWKVYRVVDEVVTPAIIFTVFFVVSALGLGFFDRAKRFQSLYILQLGVGSGVIALGLSLLFYFLVYWRAGRYAFLLGSIGGTIFPICFHLLGAVFLRKNPYRFISLGPNTNIMVELKQSVSENIRETSYRNVTEVEEFLEKSRESLSLREVVAILTDRKILAVVLSDEATKHPEILELSVRLMQVGFRVVDEISFYSEMFERYPTTALTEKWLLFSGIGTGNPLDHALKRTTDVILAIFGLVVLSPLLLGIAIAIKLTSKGPIIYSQERPGLYCRLFKIYKFRTMTVPENELGVGPNSTQKNDVRITGIGKLLRPLHLDEFPQLWNILKGEMSFVGPRPEVASFYQQIKEEIPIYEFRYLSRPGLTGLAQINQGYTDHTSKDRVKDTLEKLAHDLYYMKNSNLFFDLLIIFRTFFFLARRSR